MEPSWEYMVVSLDRQGMCDIKAEGDYSTRLNDLASLNWEVDKVLGWNGTIGEVLLRRPRPPEAGDLPINAAEENPYS